MAPSLPTGVLEAELERLTADAARLAAALGRRAVRATSHGRERAILRLLGVEGLDRDGRPLAAAAVDRYLGGRPDRLGAGIALPFALGVVEYDVTAQQLALDVAAGLVDLGEEAELLGDPERRAVAEAALAEMESAASARIDANRTARSELTDMLGEVAGPWIGMTIAQATAADAALEARTAVRDGADLLRVEVPVGGELATRLGDVGREIARWAPPREAHAARAGIERDTAPAGSQRGISLLREALDRSAVERGGYIRLATAPTALAGPEGAAVAALERVDILELDPVAEIVGVGVHPDRALVDLVAAGSLAARAGVSLHLGTGPVVVGPELVAGLPADPATRAGRGLALQLLAAAMLRDAGVPADRLLVGALPIWILGERDGVVRAAAEVALRATALADHPLAFAESGGLEPGRWPASVHVLLPPDRTALVIPRVPLMSFAMTATTIRAAVAAAVDLAGATTPTYIDGVGLEHARACARAAIDTLDRLAADGWNDLLGFGAADGGSIGGDSVAERTGSPTIFA